MSTMLDFRRPLRILWLGVLIGCLVTGCSRASQDKMAAPAEAEQETTPIVEETMDNEVPSNAPPSVSIEPSTPPEASSGIEMATDTDELAFDIGVASTHATELQANTPAGPRTELHSVTKNSAAKGSLRARSSGQRIATRAKARQPDRIESAGPAKPLEPIRDVASTAAATETRTPSDSGTRDDGPTSSSQTGPFSSLPAGSSHDAEQGFATVQVFYATDRMHGALPLSAYEMTGWKQTLASLAIVSICLFVASGLCWLLGKTRAATTSTVLGSLAGASAVAFIIAGQADIEKHGVTYTNHRGTLARGVCEVTVPDKHQKGSVERPSLLRFEIREDQREHIVLTSATELSVVEFQQRLSETVSSSPDRDVLVFIHGYNVDFESAVQRTAQLAVDLPFEGVPVCYSWPSQGTLLGYSVDETNAAWTGTHLEEFLLELAHESGADSINVIAHSMGNRPMTAAMGQIRWRWDSELDPPFDRVVLAAPDVDADRFRRDLAPSLLEVANQVTLYASSDDQALVASKKVHGYPRAGESGTDIVVVPGVETIDVSGIDLSLLGHSYYGDNASMLQELYEVVRARLPAPHRAQLIPIGEGSSVYWRLSQQPSSPSDRRLR